MKKYLLLILFVLRASAVDQADLKTVANQKITGIELASLTAADGDGGMGQWLNNRTGGQW